MGMAGNCSEEQSPYRKIPQKNGIHHIRGVGARQFMFHLCFIKQRWIPFPGICGSSNKDEHLFPYLGMLSSSPHPPLSNPKPPLLPPPPPLAKPPPSRRRREVATYASILGYCISGLWPFYSITECFVINYDWDYRWIDNIFHLKWYFCSVCWWNCKYMPIFCTSLATTWASMDLSISSDYHYPACPRFNELCAFFNI